MEFVTKTTDNQGYKYNRFQWPRAWRMAFTGKGKRVLPKGFNVWVYSLLLVLLLSASALALPNGLQASGASVNGCNGTYADHDASGNLLTDSAGNVYYTLSPNPGNYSSYIYCYQASGVYHWGFGNNPNGGNNVLYASSSTSPTTDPAALSYSSPTNGGVTLVDYTPAASAPTVASVSVSPASITGSASSAQNVTITATLSAAAPSGGATVNWTNTTAGGFTGSIGYTTQMTVPAGQTSASETAGVGASSSGGSVTFTGAYGSSSQSATVTVGAPAAAASLPQTLYVSGAGASSENGTYTLQGSSAHWYTQNGATSGTCNGMWVYQQAGWLIGSGMNAATGANCSADYGNNTYLNPTTAGSAFASQGSSGPAPVPTVSTTPPSVTGGGSSGTGALVISPGPGASGTMSTGTVTLSAASSSPVVVTLTSTAPTVASVPASVTVPAGATSATFPVTCGSLAVSGFTTVSATLSNGVSTSVIYSVNPGASGTSGTLSDGQSTFTDGTGFTTGFPASGFTAPTLPVMPLLPGVPMPTMPTFTLPGIPALGLPGDLRIGIPGIGSIGIPTGWLSKIIQYAAEASAISTGMTGAVLTSGMQYAAMTTNLAVYNGAAAMHNDLVAATAAANTNAQNTQSTISQTATQTQATLNQNTATLANTANVNAANTQSTVNTNFTSMLTAGPGGLLTQLFQYLFIPDQATMNKLALEVHNFMDWGPYAFITSTLALFQQGPATVAGAPVLPFAQAAPSLQTGMTANLSRPRALYPRQSLPPVPTANPGTDLAIPVMSVQVDNQLVLGPGGTVTAVPAGTWYNTGQSVPFDFSAMTNAKFWPFFRLMEGAGVYLVFGFGIAKKLFPKQVV